MFPDFSQQSSGVGLLGGTHQILGVPGIGFRCYAVFFEHSHFGSLEGGRVLAEESREGLSAVGLETLQNGKCVHKRNRSGVFGVCREPVGGMNG